MCRGARNCTELLHPEKWSAHAPLMPPDWLPKELEVFIDAARLAAAGDVTGARRKITLARNDDLQTWYIEHGQCSGKFRRQHFRRPKPTKLMHGLDPIASPAAFAKAVFIRDGYTCRYCGLKVVPKAVFEAFSKVVGPDCFPLGSTNLGRHGLYLNFCAVADHVTPHSIGGRTNPENLVTACWSCNYGKNEWTVDELGIEDPRLRPPSVSPTWDGLTSLVPKLRAVR